MFLLAHAETLSLESVPFPQETKLTRNQPQRQASQDLQLKTLCRWIVNYWSPSSVQGSKLIAPSPALKGKDGLSISVFHLPHVE